MTNRVVTVTLRGDWSGLRTANAQAASSVRSTAAQLDGVTARSTTAFGNAGMTAGSRFSRGLTAAARGFVGLSALYGIGRFLQDSVELEAQFSKTMNVIQATTSASGQEMEQLRSLAKKMGADTVFSANEVSDAMLELARGGLTPAQIRAGALEQTLTLAAAGQLGLADAANATVKTLGQFNLQADESSRVAAALAGGANASSASVGDMGMALAQAGLAANSVGFSVEEATGILAAFSNAGLEGSDAGTSLKTMLDRLQPSSKSTADAMKELGIITEDGANQFLKANGEYKSAADIAQVLKTATDDLTDSERKRLITAAFGSDAQRAATVLAKEGAEGIQEMVKATSDQNAAQDMANANMEGTAGALERLSGSWDTLKLSIGEGIAPIVEDGADALADLLGMMAGDDAPSGFAGDMWDAYVDHAQRSMDALGDIWDGAVEGAQNLMDSISRALEEHGGMFDSIFRNLSGFADGIYDILGPVLGWVAEHWLTGLGKEFELFADGVKLAGNVFYDVSDIALQAMSFMVENVSQGIDFILDKFQDLAEIGAALNLPGYDAIVEKIQSVRDGVSDFSDDFVRQAERRRAALDREQYLWNLTGEQADMLRNRIKALPDEVRTLIKVPGALDSFNEVKRYQKQLDLTDDEVITILQARGADLAVADIRRLKNEYDATPHDVVTIMKQSGGELTMREVRDLQKVYDLTPKQKQTLLEAVDHATPVTNKAKDTLVAFGKIREAAEADVDGSHAFSVIAGVKAGLASIHDKTVTITTFYRSDGSAVSSAGGHEAAVHSATGGPIVGKGTGTSDDVPIWASNGEHMWTAREVVNAGGHAAVEAMRARFRYAAGGPVETRTRITGRGAAYLDLTAAELGVSTFAKSTADAADATDKATDAEGGHQAAEDRREKAKEARERTHDQRERDLERAIRQSEKAFDDHREATDEARDAFRQVRDDMRSFSESVSSNFALDYQFNPEAGTSAADQLRASLLGRTADANDFYIDLKAAAANGLSGGLFNYISELGDAGLADEFAQMNRREIRRYEHLFAESQRAGARPGEFAGQERYGHELREARREAEKQTRLLEEARDDLREAKQHLKDFNHDGPERTGKAVGDAMNDTAARAGRKRART